MSEKIKNLSEYKFCTDCRNKYPKTEEYFQLRSNTKDGFRNQCRACRLVFERKNREKTVSKRHTYHKQRRKNKILHGECSYCKNKKLTNINYCEKCWYKRSGRGLKISWQELKKIAENQKFRCTYTGLPISPGCNMSLDHIKPKSKFPELASNLDNLEFIHHTVNIAKNKLTREEFLDLVRCIYHENI